MSRGISSWKKFTLKCQFSGAHVKIDKMVVLQGLHEFSSQSESRTGLSTQAYIPLITFPKTSDRMESW